MEMVFDLERQRTIGHEDFDSGTVNEAITNGGNKKKLWLFAKRIQILQIACTNRKERNVLQSIPSGCP